MEAGAALESELPLRASPSAVTPAPAAAPKPSFLRSGPSSDERERESKSLVLCPDEFLTENLIEERANPRGAAEAVEAAIVRARRTDEECMSINELLKI